MSEGTGTGTAQAPTPKQEVVVDEKTQTGLAKLYSEYRKADLKTSGKFASVVQYAKAAKLERRHLVNILIDNVKLKKESAGVEATHIANLCKPANEIILQQLLDEKITVAEARKLATSKEIAKREAEATEEKAKAEAAAKGVEYVPPPPAPKTGPTVGKPPTPFKEKIENEVAALVARVVDANDPALNEEWLTDLVIAYFESVRADRQAKEVEKAKKAGEGEANETPAPEPNAQEETAMAGANA